MGMPLEIKVNNNELNKVGPLLSMAPEYLRNNFPFHISLYFGAIIYYIYKLRNF